MQTLLEIRKTYLDNLAHLYDQDEILSIFQIIATYFLKISKTQLNLKYAEKLDSSYQEDLLDVLSQLKSGKPIQQILGEAPFYGMNFKVTKDTLIPRSETEELVDLIINQNKEIIGLDIIDIGTGTGCIAISLKKHLESAKVTAIDLSKEALEVAKINAINNQTDIDLKCIDILEWDLIFTDQIYDIIVSNPPYITRQEMKEMHNNVLQFEPHSALFVEDETPLLFYDYISSFALVHLKETGKLYFEINQYLAQEIQDLLLKKGFCHVEILDDINGSPRIVCAKFN